MTDERSGLVKQTAGLAARPRYKKRLVLATSLLTLLLVEVGVRAVIALSVGPSVLWFGTLYDRKRVAPAEMPALPERSEEQNHTRTD